MFGTRNKKEPALTTLLELYEQRPDLQEVYPEARSGQYERLITWAASASSGQCKDSSRPILAPHASWYAANFKVVSAPVPWNAAEGTSASSAFPLAITLKTMQRYDATDIGYHLILFPLLIVEFRLKNIVELGTRGGNSTLALLEAARHVDGRVFSVDVDPCLEAKRRIADADLGHLWTFIQGNDLDLEPNRLPQPIDLLFIDTNHLYRYTIRELQIYAQYLREGSWIALHDYVSFPGVNRAVKEFLESLPAKPSFYPFVHQNGLALLRVRAPQM
jgi:predicted O-methyltransferase YrrM